MTKGLMFVSAGVITLALAHYGSGCNSEQDGDLIR
jgi:hypothetical protein